MSVNVKLAVLCALSVLLTACGPLSRGDARDLASNRACDWYAGCGEIGEGETFEDRDECELETENAFNDLWSADVCTEIDGEDLGGCLEAISATQCDDAFDFFNTLFNKCSDDVVCGE